MTIHTIDLQFRSKSSAIAAFLVQSDDANILIECGPATTTDRLVSELRKLGVAPGDISDVFLTHIHFDHAGACGWWAQQGATIHVHPSGSRHLIDPQRLNESARMVYGDQMDSLWGEIIPVPEDQLHVLEDQDSVAVGNIEIRAWDSPGHARHHHAYSIGETLFTGDVAGVRLPECKFISITGAPPQFDAIAYEQSIQRLKAEGFTELYLTHFGRVEDVNDHWTRYSEWVAETTRFMASQMHQDSEEIRKAYQEHCFERAMIEGLSPIEWEAYECANPSQMSADGIALYLSRLNSKK